MSRDEVRSQISVEALLESGKSIPREPEAVRERVLSRARASLAAPLALVGPTPPARPRFAQAAAAPAAAAAGALMIAGAVYALSSYGSRPEAPGSVVPSSAPAARPVDTVTTPRAADVPAPSASSGAELVPDARPAPTSPRRTTTARDSYAAEIGLMRSAHTAFAAHDFASALVLVGEHARRFPGGLLAEEREALRVKSLLGSGRAAEARRAAASFGKRFPRSVLVPRMEAAAKSGE